MRSKLLVHNRIKRLLTALLTLAGLGCLLYLSSLFWECPIRYYLGIPCPGCGFTGAFLRLLHLDFAGAFLEHPMIYPVIAYIAFAIGCFTLDRTRYLFSPWYWGTLSGLFILTWIVRLAV